MPWSRPPKISDAEKLDRLNAAMIWIAATPIFAVAAFFVLPPEIYIPALLVTWWRMERARALADEVCPRT